MDDSHKLLPNSLSANGAAYPIPVIPSATSQFTPYFYYEPANRPELLTEIGHLSAEYQGSKPARGAPVSELPSQEKGDRSYRKFGKAKAVKGKFT